VVLSGRKIAGDDLREDRVESEQLANSLMYFWRVRPALACDINYRLAIFLLYPVQKITAQLEGVFFVVWEGRLALLLDRCCMFTTPSVPRMLFEICQNLNVSRH
jgi:hypothetical protein